MAKLVKNLLVIAEMRKASHPPYSPGLAPLHFCLFSHMKQVTVGQSFSSSEEHLSTNGVILKGIENTTLIAVFQESMQRLAQYSNIDGEHTELSAKNA
jgi:hypothetical protein